MVFLRRAAQAAGYAAVFASDEPAPRRSRGLLPAFVSAGALSGLAMIVLMF